MNFHSWQLLLRHMHTPTFTCTQADTNSPLCLPITVLTCVCISRLGGTLGLQGVPTFLPHRSWHTQMHRGAFVQSPQQLVRLWYAALLSAPLHCTSVRATLNPTRARGKRRPRRRAGEGRMPHWRLQGSTPPQRPTSTSQRRRPWSLMRTWAMSVTTWTTCESPPPPPPLFIPALVPAIDTCMHLHMYRTGLVGFECVCRTDAQVRHGFQQVCNATRKLPLVEALTRCADFNRLKDWRGVQASIG